MTNRFFCSDFEEGSARLDEVESQHCIKVLRLGEGADVELLDGKGGLYRGNIQEPHPKKCIIKITGVERTEPRKRKLSICISPTKSIDRIEWFIEKAVEIGIEEVFFIATSRSERKHINIERVEKKAISALKQSGNRYLPKINEMKPLKEVLGLIDLSSARYIAHLIPGETRSLKDFNQNNSSHFTFLIGPEGDFTEEEVELCLDHGFEPLGLGKSVLRTETAGIYICSFFSFREQLKDLQ